ncbi:MULTISPECIES: DUF2771 domain-containing protein [unclassified Corynebacterium]|uniref:DUF2771 domain-containing protein n=1 Tax=unclassified Corynebacterium TaxID=2624378 RepID=UPI0029CA30FB|nr:MULTISPECIES: DUF2771 domain-containing protein [unclassified Corynebacterium]WPF66734.1 DUF2771 domain-containing protein [Corynebacterium sp. 22KM0430]WPF69222.1 DUF2771 domain-containing protein [Corynebacterium sp. 21KM1197]
MATRKKGKHRSLVQILALLITVVIVIVALYLFQTWWNDRPDPEPQDIQLTATVGEEKKDLSPYMVCEVGATCEGGEVPTMAVGENDELVLDLPEPVYDHHWSLLTIYDDPAYNDETIYEGHQQKSVTVPGSVDPAEEGAPRPRLMVVEVNSALIGTDDQGEPTPFSTVWSVGNSEVPRD